MNRIIFCCVVLLKTTTIWSQQSAPGISFQKPLGGSSHEISFTNKNSIDGGFIIGGVSSSRDGDIARSKGGADLWVVKMKNNNTIQWEKTLGGSNKEKGTIVNEIKNADGSSAGFFVGGTTSSSNGDVKGYKGGASDIWIVKLNTAGVIIWQRALGGSDVDEIISMETAADGGCIVAGNTKSRNGDVTGSRGAEDIWIVKLSATGILLWQKTFGTAGSETVQDRSFLGRKHSRNW